MSALAPGDPRYDRAVEAFAQQVYAEALSSAAGIARRAPAAAEEYRQGIIAHAQRDLSVFLASLAGENPAVELTERAYWCPDCGATGTHLPTCGMFPGRPVIHGNPAAPGDQQHEAGMCGRLLVGQGDETSDPLCVLPKRHKGSCRPALPLAGAGKVPDKEPAPAANAVMVLLAADRRRSVTVQWMPQDDRGPERFEVINVHTGDYEHIVSLDETGEPYTDPATLTRLQGAMPPPEIL